MASNGEMIMGLNEQGELLLIRANPAQFELLDRKTIADQETWGHVAVAGDEVFVRELHGVSAFKWTGSTTD